MRKLIPTLIIQFANELAPHEIPLFRGAVIASLNEKNILFHNHAEDGVVYHYPLIQYKRIHQKAAIVCLKGGIEAVHELFSAGNFIYKIGEREVDMYIESIKTYNNEVGFCEKFQSYRLLNWLPLNSKNYEQYQTIDGLADKINFLEEKLIGNLLSFFTEMAFRAEEEIVIRITDIKAQKLIRYKKVRMMSFDIEFKANLILPQYIGIGKSASVGFGTLTRISN